MYLILHGFFILRSIDSLYRSDQCHNLPASARWMPENPTFQYAKYRVQITHKNQLIWISKGFSGKKTLSQIRCFKQCRNEDFTNFVLIWITLTRSKHYFVGKKIPADAGIKEDQHRCMSILCRKQAKTNIHSISVGYIIYPHKITVITAPILTIFRTKIIQPASGNRYRTR